MMSLLAYLVIILFLVVASVGVVLRVIGREVEARAASDIAAKEREADASIASLRARGYSVHIAAPGYTTSGLYEGDAWTPAGRLIHHAAATRPALVERLERSAGPERLELTEGL